VLCGDEQDSVHQEGDVEDVDGMVLLLAEGLPDDAEKVVWCGVVWCGVVWMQETVPSA
jgi:hypothetical protein